MIFSMAADVSDSEETAMVLPPSSVSGTRENSKMLLIGPVELMECQGSKRYLFLFFRNSMEEEGLMSSSPVRSILFSFEGTPLMNVYSELLQWVSR